MAILTTHATSPAVAGHHSRAEDDRREECWEGDIVMAPIAGIGHQGLAGGLTMILGTVIRLPGLGRVYPGINVSDRAEGWAKNYRCPDVAVYLTGNPAANHGSYYQGGPDLAVEIISEGEDPYAKLSFYAAVSTRELLIVHRDLRALELFTLVDGALQSPGRSDLASPTPLASMVTGVTFRLVQGTTGPEVEVTHPASGCSWRA